MALTINLRRWRSTTWAGLALHEEVIMLLRGGLLAGGWVTGGESDRQTHSEEDTSSVADRQDRSSQVRLLVRAGETLFRRFSAGLRENWVPSYLN